MGQREHLMTPERERQIRTYAGTEYIVDRSKDPWLAIRYLDEVLSALDTERERNAKLERVAEAAQRRSGKHAGTDQLYRAIAELEEALADLETSDE